MLDLTRDQVELVRQILAQVVPGLPVLAFGSRVTGRARRFSDLDLVLQTSFPLESGKIAAIREAFSDSDLAIRVDVLDYADLSPSFRNVVDHSEKVAIFP